jgi:hypothetical protein
VGLRPSTKWISRTPPSSDGCQTAVVCGSSWGMAPAVLRKVNDSSCLGGHPLRRLRKFQHICRTCKAGCSVDLARRAELVIDMKGGRAAALKSIPGRGTLKLKLPSSAAVQYSGAWGRCSPSVRDQSRESAIRRCGNMTPPYVVRGRFWPRSWPFTESRSRSKAKRA